jgi:HK97 family phage portal protein
MIKRIKNFFAPRVVEKALSPPDNRGWVTILESFMGAWQTNTEISVENAFQHPIVYACVTLIAGDIGKLGLRLTELQHGIWTETESPAFSPVFRKPNHYQTRKQFIESWCICKQMHGNVYVLKIRDNRNMVKALYILDPQKVQPLVADNGDVFYALHKDNISALDRDFPAVPASEIIHDRMNCLFHPLVGIPPLYAGALAIKQGLNMQNNSEKFFGNMAMPSGMLTAPGAISNEVAARLKTEWQTKYGGENLGKVAVAGDGLEFKQFTMTAVDSQLIDQLKWSDEKICSVFKVPPYKVGVGPMPTYDNAEVLDRIYYSGCLQTLIESIEEVLDDGLRLPTSYRTEFDLDDLMRMDTRLKMNTAAEGVQSGIMSPNEGRRRFSLLPVAGGDTPYLQVQNYSLAALDARDRNSLLTDNNPPNLSEDDIKGLAGLMLFMKMKETVA